jgi:hypothetical protein
MEGLADRLKRAMQVAAAETRFSRAKELKWRTGGVVLPPREEQGKMLSESEKWVASANQSDAMRAYEGAMRISFVKRLWRPVAASSLEVGNVRIVHLPGEPMLEFQTFAQRLMPGSFVAVAGYGDCGPAYICTERAIAEGGYEPSASNVGQGSERQLKNCIEALLGVCE